MFRIEKQISTLTNDSSIICNVSALRPDFTQPLTEIQEGDLYFCLEYRSVEVCGQEIELTAREFDIFALLIPNPHRVFTYEMIMEDLDKIIQRLYEDSALGKISNFRFQKRSAQYETEQAEIQRLAVSLEREIENESGPTADVGRFLQLTDRYSDLRELDAATVNELIEKIVIHSPERIGGKKHVTIEVYFTYDRYGKTGVTFATPVFPKILFTSLWDSA